MLQVFCTTAVASVMVAMVTSQALAITRPWITDDAIKVLNRTDTSVILAWKLPIELSESDMPFYRLIVSYKRRGYSAIIIEAQPSDPDCSLLLSHCHLRNLEPGEAYSAEITIDYSKNRTSLGRAELPFATLDTPSSAYHGLVWWLLFAGIPSVVFLALVLVMLGFARCCGCCCWRKKAKSRASDKTGEREQSPEYTCPSSPGTPPRDRFHSLQTQKWVRDAPDIIELDPESTYDHPQPSSAGYLIPGLRKGSQAYVQMDESPTGAAGLPEAPRVFNKRAATMSYGKKKGKQLKKSQTTHSLLSQTSSELSSPSNMDPRPLPKPCKLKRKDADVQKCASLPSVHNQQHQLKSPKESTLMFDFQQQLQAQIQQQQQQQEQTQTAEEVVQYANTQDLIKLKGSARKMFPML